MVETVLSWSLSTTLNLYKRVSAMCRRLLIDKRLCTLLSTGQADISLGGLSSIDLISVYVAPLMRKYCPSKVGLPSVLIIAPTIEAVERISRIVDSKRPKTAMSVACIGGTDIQADIKQLARGSDYVIGTPGRLAKLHASQSLVTSSVGAVVLHQAETLLTSQVVIDFVKSGVPSTTQRVFVAESIDKWLRDTLDDLRRPGHKLEEVSNFAGPLVESFNKHSHVFSKTASSDERRQLRSVIDTVRWKSIVFCRTAADVFVLSSDPMFSDVIALTPDMSPKVQESQLAKFKTARKASLFTVDTKTIGKQVSDVELVVNLGVPRNIDDYKQRFGFLQSDGSENGSRICTIFKTSESQYFSKLRSGVNAPFLPLPIQDSDECTITFAKSLLKSSAVTDPWITKESVNLINLYGPDLLGSVLQLAESRRSLFEKRSPLSGHTGYTPVLLFDPFMKKIKNYETADKLVKGCLRMRISEKDKRKAVQIGRIALSTKGFVVDVPSDVVGNVVDNRHLKMRNIKAICVSELPPLVQSDRLFAINRNKRDKMLNTRSLKKRRSISK